MGFLDKLFDLGRSAATVDVQLDHVGERLNDGNRRHDTAESRFDRIDAALNTLAERVAKLEAYRDGDRREIGAMLTQLRLEADRLELVRTSLPSTGNA